MPLKGTLGRGKGRRWSPLLWSGARGTERDGVYCGWWVTDRRRWRSLDVDTREDFSSANFVHHTPCLPLFRSQAHIHKYCLQPRNILHSPISYYSTPRPPRPRPLPRARKPRPPRPRKGISETTVFGRSTANKSSGIAPVWMSSGLSMTSPTGSIILAGRLGRVWCGTSGGDIRR